MTALIFAILLSLLFSLRSNNTKKPLLSRDIVYILCITNIYSIYTMSSITFPLSQADSRPMYQQIVDGIKRLIASGEWASGHSLPSIREFAVSMKVSVITVKRAYQELEREGLIVTRQGLGSFVSFEQSVFEQAQRVELEEAIDGVFKRAELMGMNRDELLNLIESQLASSPLKGGGKHNGR